MKKHVMYLMQYVEPNRLSFRKPGWTIGMQLYPMGFRLGAELSAFFTCPKCGKINHLEVIHGSVEESMGARSLLQSRYYMSSDESGCFSCLRCRSCRRPLKIYMNGFTRRWFKERAKAGYYYRWALGRILQERRGLGKFLTKEIVANAEEKSAMTFDNCTRQYVIRNISPNRRLRVMKKVSRKGKTKKGKVRG